MANKSFNLFFRDNHNNKLMCNSWALLQPWDDERFPVNQVFTVYWEKGTKHTVERTLIGTATLVSRRRVPLDKLTELHCRLDTGYGVDETKRMIHRMWSGKADVMFFGCFAWVTREAVELPQRGIVGRTYKLARQMKQAKIKDGQQRLQLIADKHADKSTLITGKNPAGGFDKYVTDDQV